MNKELDEKLTKEFPLLYKKRYLGPDKTCMHWGFECGDGWFNLIYDLSKKLEPLIEKQVNHDVCDCGESKEGHENGEGRCTVKYKVQYQVNLINKQYYCLKTRFDKIRYNVSSYLNDKLYTLYKKFGIGKKVPSKCEKFSPGHPTAEQVKEKFGTLRFYVSDGTDEMYRLIEEAEVKSETTCEICGEKGRQTKTSWVKTLCEQHDEERRRDMYGS